MLYPYLLSLSVFVTPFGDSTAFVTIWREGFVGRQPLLRVGYDGCPELRYCLSYSAVNCWDSYKIKSNQLKNISLKYRYGLSLIFITLKGVSIKLSYIKSKTNW
jgi:hypothetical protein